MKRTLVGLVEYPSSEEETPTKQKRRRLPALSSSLTVPTPVDNPALHQGRVRAVPHVEGQYATYIYVPLVLDHKDALYTLVEDALTVAKARVPCLHTIVEQGVPRWELHLSLSRPLFLRAHQHEEFKRAVGRVASSIAPFNASFATFSELTNDERTRTFLALEVGAGHGELRRCLDLLGPILRSLREKEFYVDPKFHTSIAWALMEPPSDEPDEFTLLEHASPSVIEQPSDDFHRIPRFPPTLIPSLNETYAAKLSQACIGGFFVGRISMKIGKDVFTWSLSGLK